jgi:hypothetical protein
MKKILLSRLLTLLLAGIVFPVIIAFAPQEAKVNQRKIDRDRAKKEKLAWKEYKTAVREHEKRQSQETRSMMKQSKKDARKNTPLKKKNALSSPGRKNCK